MCAEQSSAELAGANVKVAEYDLKLNKDKSGIVELGPRSGGAISFLGFILYWGKAQVTKCRLKIKTAPERLRKAVQKFTDWIKEARNQLPIKELWKRATARIRGHYNYYAVSHNGEGVNKYYFSCIRAMFKWLNRRSQKKSFTWKEFVRKLMFNPLPKTPLGYELIDVTSKFSTELKHKPKSRMRKSRTSGSERSGGRQRPLFT